LPQRGDGVGDKPGPVDARLLGNAKLPPFASINIFDDGDAKVRGDVIGDGADLRRGDGGGISMERGVDSGCGCFDVCVKGESAY
jgi:hypothetical protein